jgi:hypothetical protein
LGAPLAEFGTSRGSASGLPNEDGVHIDSTIQHAGARRPDSSSEPLALANHFQERLRDERFLVTQRVSWLLLSQSFLFLAYTALVVARPGARREQQAVRLYHAVPLLGIVIVAGVYASIIAAVLTGRALRRQFGALETKRVTPFDPIPNARLRALGDVAIHLPPLAIGATWITLLVSG